MFSQTSRNDTIKRARLKSFDSTVFYRYAPLVSNLFPPSKSKTLYGTHEISAIPI